MRVSIKGRVLTKMVVFENVAKDTVVFSADDQVHTLCIIPHKWDKQPEFIYILYNTPSTTTFIAIRISISLDGSR